MLGSFDTKHMKQYISTILYTWHEILLFYIEIVLSLLRSEYFTCDDISFWYLISEMI